MAHDDVFRASFRIEMLDLLAGLRERHGDHPVLLETVADYTDDDAEAAALYRRAVDIAVANELPTLSIRVAFARVLVDLGEPAVALEELRACGSEAAGGSEGEQREWVGRLKDVAYDAADDAERAALYRRAMEIAAAQGLPTLRIRLLFVRFLLDVGEAAAALEELRTCGSEASGGDEEARTWWAELFEEAGRA